jgi:opacity protein-like surface antigen
MKKFLLCLGIWAICLALAAPAGAAGWYLRGTLGLEWSLAADFADGDSGATNPPALFGTGPGNDGRRIGADGDFGRSPLLEAALGRQFLPWLRAEFALAYRHDLRYRGEANFRNVPGPQPVEGSVDSLSGLAILYLDIAGLPGVRLGRFQPYLGAGVGAAHNRLAEMTYRFPNNPGAHKITITPGGNRTDLALTAAVGTGIVLSEHLVLDLAWRYTDLGRAYTDAGRAHLNNIAGGINIGETWAPLRTHGLFAGLRYGFR